MDTSVEMTPERSPGSVPALSAHWLTFVVLGLVLIVMGAIALGSYVVASLATAVAVGVLMLASGVVEVAGALWARSWSGFFLHLASGVLGIVVGVFFLRAPVGAMLALTLLLACLLMVGGILRIVGAISYRFEGRGWTVASGVIDLILGMFIWMEWPAAALWVLGLYVGVSLVIRGANWVAVGLSLRAVRRRLEGVATA